MARFRRSFRRFSGSRRARSLDWCGVVKFSSTRTTNGSTESEICTASELNAKYTNPTLRRLVGDIYVRVINANNPPTSTNVGGDVYLGVILQDVTNTTPPAIETGDGWNRDWTWTRYVKASTAVTPLYSTTGAGGQGTLGVIATENAPFAQWHVPLDSRVMRKIQRFESVSLIIGVSNIAASTTILVEGAIRALIQE